MNYSFISQLDTNLKEQLISNNFVKIEGFLNKNLVDFFLDKMDKPASFVNSTYFEGINNSDVKLDTGSYWYGDFESKNYTLCYNYWSKNRCSLTTDLIFKVQMLRNIFEGKPQSNGLTPYSIWVPQVRLVNSKNVDCAVGKHRDFVEDYRKDPTGTHDYRPEAVQITIALSSLGLDYTGVGFYFINSHGDEVSPAINSGDLVIWPYNAWHGVKEVYADQEQRGFSRMIFPMFERKKLC